MYETAKKAIYATVGAPVITARRVGERMAEVRESVGGRATKLMDRIGTDARKEFEAWAEEGEKILARLSEQPMVEDFTSRVDIDQLQGQMHRIREQLDDMLQAWRESFRPEKETVQVKPAAEKAAAPTKPEAPAARPKAAAAQPKAKQESKPKAKQESKTEAGAKTDQSS